MRAREFTLPPRTWTLVISSAHKQELAPDLIQLVQQAYAQSPQGSFVQGIQDVMPSDSQVMDCDGDATVDATVFYRGPRSGEPWTGHKIQGIGHDGTTLSRQAVIQQLSHLLAQPGWWVEASHALRSVLLRRLPPIQDVQLLQSLFPGSDLTMVDSSTYRRTLPHGATIQETVFGHPELA